MKYITFVFFFGLTTFTFGQLTKSKWSHAPFSNLGIADNNGKYETIMGDSILFYSSYGPYRYLFTSNGIIVGQQEKISPEERWERHEKQEHGEQISRIPWNYFKLEWLNSNSTFDIVTLDKNHHTLNFQNPNNLDQTLKSNTYNKLVYQNFYDGIDLEFEMPKEGGLKYSFVLHPGSSASTILMQFESASFSIDLEGQLNIISEIDPFKDKAPIAWFSETESEIDVDYKIVNDAQVQFIIEAYDTSKTIIIDPWLVPALPFTDTQQAYDIGMDNEGNVSVLGQHGNQVAHYDNTGLLEWVWTYPGELNEFYGDLDVNPITGHTYCMNMGLYMGIDDIFRLDLAGVVSEGIFYSSIAGDPGELWRMRYNDVHDELVIGAGGLPRDAHLCIVDGDLTTNSQYAPLVPMPPNLTDATYLDLDPCGEFIYLLCSGDAPPLYNNVLYKVERADPTSIVWEVATEHTYEEISCIGYMGYEVMTGEGPDWYSANGHNGIAVGFDVYTYDGDTLNRWDKITGSFLGNVSVTPLDLTIYGDLAFCGGIDTDICGNVYIGTEDSLIKYSRELEYIEAIALPDTCFDLRIVKNKMSTCGSDFVESYDFEPLVDYSMSSTPQPCGDCSGTASIETTSVCPELSFATVLWSPGGQTTPTAVDLCAGWYTATITWTNGLCDSIVRVDSVEVVIGAPGDLHQDISMQTCSDDCDGAVEITVTGGFPPFVFDLEGDVNATGIYTGLCPGTYDLIVTDVDGCTFVDSVVIGEVDALVIEEVITHEACEGACNGTITLTPTSGVAPFEFTFDGEPAEDGVFEDLCVGSYTVTAIDSNGCSYENTIVIEVGESLGLDTVLYNTPTCYGFSDGSVTVDTEIGVEPVTYTWVPENPVEGASFNSMSAGIYEVYAVDAFGCTDTLVFEMTQPDSLWAEIETTNPLCYGDSTGTAVITDVHNAQGDLDNISFFWAPNYFGENGVGIDSAYNMPKGDYTVTINDDNGCSNVMDFSITEPAELVLAEFDFYPAYCRLHEYQSGNGVVFVAAAGGVPDYDYNWVNLETLEEEVTSTWGGLNPGTYQITVTDNNGCSLIQTIELDSVNPIAAFDVISDQLNTDLEGTELVIANFVNQSENFANPHNPSADTTFMWNLDHPNNEWYISHDYFEPVDTTYTGEEVYEVCLIAMNKNGCADTTCKDIIVHVQPELIAPNVFTPGSNGLNDLFTFEHYAAGIETFHCSIVNRWGIKVAELNTITDGWDGTDLNGDDCTNGVYFYSYEAVSTNGTAFNGQGNVQLVRE